MFCKKEIKFRKHTVLRANTLQEACSVPIELIELQYDNWSDGIVKGVHISVTPEALIISPGIIRYRQMLFHMTESVMVAYTSGSKQQSLCIHFGECKENENGKYYETDLLLTDNMALRSGDMELARFCLQDGAVLRSDYKNFADLETEYNTLNYLCAKYAGYKEDTLASVILEEYAKEAITCEGLDGIDMTFLAECYRGQNVSRATIRLYIQQKLHKKIDENADNKMLYDGLKSVLRQLHTAKRNSVSATGRRIMID